MPDEQVIEVTVAIPLGNADATVRDQQRVCHAVEEAVRTVYPDARVDWHDLRKPHSVRAEAVAS